jgi:hypothetical protein
MTSPGQPLGITSLPHQLLKGFATAARGCNGGSSAILAPVCFLSLDPQVFSG